MSLEQDLAGLSEALPHLPDEVNGLGQAAHELEAAAQQLLGNLTQARQDVTSLLNHARNIVPGLTTLLEALEHRLSASLDGVDKAWNDGHGQLDEGEHALVEAASHVNAARTDLMKELFQAATAVDQSSADGDAAMGRVESAAREGSEKVHAAAHGVTTQLAQLKAALEKSKAALQDAGEALLDRFKNFRDNADTDASNIIDYVRHREDQYTSHLAALEKQFSDKVGDLIVHVGPRITDGTVNPVGLAVENFRIEVERLGADAASHKDELAKGREALNESLGGLKASEPPLHSAMEAIETALKAVTQ
jgi:uncharacterized phage infection (PIP) family protein YhgE